MSSHLERIMDIIGSQKEWNPILTIDEFFEGNPYEQSIGVNLFPHPGLEEFHRVLKKLEQTQDVDMVWV